MLPQVKRQKPLSRNELMEFHQLNEWVKIKIKEEKLVGQSNRSNIADVFA